MPDKLPGTFKTEGTGLDYLALSAATTLLCELTGSRLDILNKITQLLLSVTLRCVFNIRDFSKLHITKINGLSDAPFEGIRTNGKLCQRSSTTKRQGKHDR